MSKPYEVDIHKLQAGEIGERVKLREAYKWILHDMEYGDFCLLANLGFVDKNDGYPFRYQYMVPEETDSPSAREEYLKYLMYKLVQNLCTPFVELEDR